MLKALIALPAIVLSVGAQEVEPVLLPNAPEGWRFERLKFPLQFAPDLDYDGFEELRFAPGMFDAESDSYFSYAMAFRLDESVRVDAAFLARFFDSYYRGLCVATAQARDLELDLTSFGVTVTDSATGYVLDVDMIDVFVTGEPVDLRVELEVHAAPGRTELFGLAWPPATDAKVWSTLHDLRKDWLAARPAPAYFNHLYVVPDPETFEALANSEFLRTAFSPFEQRETVRTDTSYTGIYFYGHETYFEFLPPTAARPAGSSGIAFGFDRGGATTTYAEELAQHSIKTFAGPVTREVNGIQVPWFRVLGIEKAHAESRLDMFTLEYEPQFLAQWHPASAPAHTGIARRNILERYAAKLRQTELRTDGLFLDVARVRLALDERERERLAQVLRVFGYTIDEHERAEEAWICHGPGIEIAIELSVSPGQVIGFELALRPGAEEMELALGKARIQVTGDNLTFSFPR